MNRRFARFLAAVLLFGGIGVARDVHAINYSENFNAGTATGWTPLAGTWSLTGGAYVNTGVLASAITLYGGATWSTSYTYEASVYNQYTASGNKAGLIYNYVDASNYYSITIAGNSPGTVTLTKVLAGVTTTTTASLTVSGTKTWFVVDVIRSGTTTTIKVAGTIIFNAVSQPELGAGKIGLIATNTNSTYDTVSVTSSSDITAPSAPSALTLTPVSATQINLSWTASTDNVGVTGYRIERCSGVSCTAFTQVAIPTTTTYSDTGLFASTSYGYRVLATDAAGNLSAYSSIVAATTLAAPTDYSENFNAGTATGWTPLAGTWSLTGGAYVNTGVLASAITLYGGATWSTNFTYEASVLNQYSASGNKAGLVYCYVDANNYYSITIAGNSPATVTLTKVIAGISTATTATLTVSGANTSFVVDVIRSSTTTTIKVAGTVIFSSVSQPELGAGKIGLIATNAQAKYDSVTVTSSGDTTAPSAPSGLTLTPVSATQINLSWTASTDSVGVTGYRIERCSGVSCTTFAQIATPTTTTYSDTGLTASTNYSYQVRAADAAGNLSGYSTTATAATLAASGDTTPPVAPTGLSAGAASPSQVNLNWTASTDNVGVVGYRVERCAGTVCTTFAQIATPTATTYSDTGLTASTSYSYRVLATDAAGNSSAYSAVATVTTPALSGDTTPPTAPSRPIVVATTGKEIDLAWTVATDNVGVAGYYVERCVGVGCSTFLQIGVPSSPGYNDAGLTAVTSYSYRVRAHDAAGNLSPYSGTLTASTLVNSSDCN